MNKTTPSAPADVPPLLTDRVARDTVEGLKYLATEVFKGPWDEDDPKVQMFRAIQSGRVGVYDKEKYRLVALRDEAEKQDMGVGSEAAVSSSASSASRLDYSGSVQGEINLLLLLLNDVRMLIRHGYEYRDRDLLARVERAREHWLHKLLAMPVAPENSS